MSINKILRPSSTTKDINGHTGTVALRNYQHASRIFLDGDYRLSPKYGFLFYVEFDFNPMITNISNTAAQELGMIVKSCSLPKFTIDTKIHNAYNRKNIVQNKIQYDPVSISFHDDQADNVRNFWYDYYSFFYRDSDYADASYSIIHKYQERPSFEWGYSPRPVGSYNSSNGYQEYQYIQAIRIYSLYQKNFSEYELINPIITKFNHGDHQNSENNLMEHQMTISYETVKYQTGYTTKDTVGGYIDLHYDTVPSPISPDGGPGIIDNGQGGYTGVPDAIIDLASINLKTDGGTVIPGSSYGVLNPAYSFASTVGPLIRLNSGAGTNSGGFSLPALGSLTSGISNSNITGQLIQQATVSLAGTVASTLAGGVVKGFTDGLGPNGTAIVSLAASAIANPSAALKTVTNMAVKFAMGAITQGINSLATKAGTAIANTISSGIGSLNTSLAFGGASTLTAGISNSVSNAFGDLSRNLTISADYLLNAPAGMSYDQFSFNYFGD